MKMGQLCDFCGEQRSMVHCRSDAACLCLSCDRNVHSANALSKRHLRTLLCERCHSQPATTRCIDENTSLCEDCNWTEHAAPASAVEHKRQTINLYSGCPSAAEFSRIWPFFSVDESTCNPELPKIDCSTEDSGLDTIAPDNEKFHGSGPLNALNHKACLSRMKHLEPAPDIPCQNFDISDVELSLEDYEALFDESIDDPQHIFENGEVDCFYEIGDFYGTTECNVDSIQMKKASSSNLETMKQTCSKPLSSESMTNCKSDSILCVPSEAPSTFSISFTGQATECKIGDRPESGGFSSVIVEEHDVDREWEAGQSEEEQGVEGQSNQGRVTGSSREWVVYRRRGRE